MRKTKIIATIGPSSDSEVKIEQLILAGVNVFRFNFSHGTQEYHEANLVKIRAISARLKKHIGILADISGPKIRLGQIDGEILLNVGDILEIYKENILGSGNKVSLNQPQILDDLKLGDFVYISDGTIRLEVVEIFGDKINAKTIIGGKITSKKGVNFPGTRISINPITKKDEDDIKFGCKIGVDFFALSFVTSRQNIIDAKNIINSQNFDAHVFAKIERFEALECIDEILAESDGIMVARGDLGVELGIELVPVYQKMLIEKANEFSKPVITATQMLSSMLTSQYPTRAEVSDVANAVLDGTDCVMLSDETTVGKYPVEAINILNKVLIETEKIYPYYKYLSSDLCHEHAISASADMLARNIKANAMIVYTKTGDSAIVTSKFRPQCKIFANSFTEATLRRLSIVWGVEPCYTIPLNESFQDHSDYIIHEFLKRAFADNKIDPEWSYVVTFGKPLGQSLHSNTIRIIDKNAVRMFENNIGKIG